MNRRELLTGLASLVVPVPKCVTAPFVVNCGGRVGGIRAGSALLKGQWVNVKQMPDGSWLAEASIENMTFRGTVTV
jgi:hypothetical protein